jgi:acyl-CoA reductase-like NAD-dependent aldehyde dehydrogenase
VQHGRKSWGEMMPIRRPWRKSSSVAEMERNSAERECERIKAVLRLARPFVADMPTDEADAILAQIDAALEESPK